MPEIGVLDLKTHASAIIRSVREQRTRYVITQRGKPVGLLLPLDEGTYPSNADASAGAGAWDEIVRLGEEIGNGWPPGLTGAEVLSSMRR
jgi:prevent-host-death family protein